MKMILLGATPPPIGGIAQWTVRMLNSRLKNGWEIRLVDERSPYGREMFGESVKRDLKAETNRWLNVWKNLNRELKDKDAKVVHACPTAAKLSMLAELVSAIITRLHGRRFVAHFRCTIPNMIHGKLDRFILKHFCGLSSLIIVLNSQSEEYLKTVTKTRIELIPNFADSDELCADRTVRDTVKRAVYVGGVIASKGCDDILSAAARLPGIEFRLVGRPEAAIAQRAKQYPNVVLTGPVPHETVKQELQDADLFLFLSTFPGEGFSNALVEAMASGLPCIVSDWAANADMIEDGRGGVVVKPGDVEGVVQAFSRESDPGIREAQSAYNQNKVRQQYASRIVLDRYVDCYESLL